MLFDILKEIIIIVQQAFGCRGFAVFEQCFYMSEIVREIRTAKSLLAYCRNEGRFRNASVCSAETSASVRVSSRKILRALA